MSEQNAEKVSKPTEECCGFKEWLFNEAVSIYLDRAVTMVRYQETNTDIDKQEWLKHVELFNLACKVGGMYERITPIEYCAKVYKTVKEEGTINLFLT